MVLRKTFEFEILVDYGALYIAAPCHFVCFGIPVQINEIVAVEIAKRSPIDSLTKYPFTLQRKVISPWAAAYIR